jgi:hypothetical protein
MSVSSAVKYNDIPIGNQNLAQTLTFGNDGVGQSIKGINDVSLNTINGLAYPPVGSIPTISQVLSAGSVASSAQTLTGLAKLGATDVSLNSINSVPYPFDTGSGTFTSTSPQMFGTVTTYSVENVSLPAGKYILFATINNTAINGGSYNTITQNLVQNLGGGQRTTLTSNTLNVSSVTTFSSALSSYLVTSITTNIQISSSISGGSGGNSTMSGTLTYIRIG